MSNLILIFEAITSLFNNIIKIISELFSKRKENKLAILSYLFVYELEKKIAYLDIINKGKHTAHIISVENNVTEVETPTDNTGKNWWNWIPPLSDHPFELKCEGRKRYRLFFETGMVDNMSIKITYTDGENIRKTEIFELSRY